MVKSGLTWSVKSFSPDALAVATRSLKLAVCTVVGVPLRTPVLALSVTPAGSEAAPVTTDHVRVPVPPIDASVTEYGVPTAASGSGEAVVIVIPWPKRLCDARNTRQASRIVPRNIVR
jgi:hypothetical protein